MKARRQQHQDVRPSRQQILSEKNDNEDNIFPLTTATYDNICNTISLIIQSLKKSSKTDCFQSLVGYQILQHRTSVDDYKLVDSSVHKKQPPPINMNPRQIIEYKRKWKEAMQLANQSHRYVLNRYRRQGKDSTTTTTTNENEYDNEVTTQEQQETDESDKEKVPPDYSRYCSVCGTSSSTNKDARFTTLPRIIDLKPDDNMTDNKHRRMFYIQAHRRNICLDRLNLNHKLNVRYIYIYIYM
jgi:hypothetical protein